MNAQPAIRFVVIIAVFGTLPILALACNTDIGDGPPATGDGTSAAESVPPSIAEIGSATIEGIYDAPVLLSGGVFEGEPFVEGSASRPRVELLDYHASGELNDSPGDETAVFLSENSGGSGTFLYLAVMGRSSGEIRNLGTALIGDRVQVQGIRLENGVIVVDVLQPGPDDPMCCPSEQANRAWRFADGELVELE